MVFLYVVLVIGVAVAASWPVGRLAAWGLSEPVRDTGFRHGIVRGHRFELWLPRLYRILYEFTSSAANNGSGFEGLGDNTVPWNIITGLVMLLGRFLPLVLPMAIAGSQAAKKPSPETSGSLPTDTLLFGGVLFGCVIIVGALLFLPAAAGGGSKAKTALFAWRSSHRTDR